MNTLFKNKSKGDKKPSNVFLPYLIMVSIERSLNRNSKGQYRIVSEVMLLGVGIIVTLFIFLSFQDLENRTKDLSLRDQLNSVSNLVSSAIIKAKYENTTMRLDLPSKLSGSSYRISASSDFLVVEVIDDPIKNITRFLNMGEYNITGSLVSEFVEVSSKGKNIELKGY